MIAQHFELAKGFINPNYVIQAEQSRNSRTKLITSLLTQRRMPDKGWDEATIQLFLDELSSMDSNNFLENVGVGEREGRVICDLVRRRHFGLTHGIGRSGDVNADQPKAAGSSLIVQLTRHLALDAIHLAGIKALKTCCVLPTATGLSMTLVLLALRQLRPAGKYVVWSRIDQKSCFKAIGAAGATPVVVELLPLEDSDALGTDVPGIRGAIERVGAGEVLCVISTTSTFAPRVPDSVDEIAELCAELAVPHVVNNAYGLQCSKCAHLVESACRKGRVDAVVQSTDKNFLVPVGGAIVAAPKGELVEKVSSLYPGRAAMSPILDLFITLLHLGAAGWKDLLKSRKEDALWFQGQLQAASAKHGLQLLRCPANKISFAVDLSSLQVKNGQTVSDELAFLGSVLFTRRVSGPRVVLCAPPLAVVPSSAPVPGTAKLKGYRKTIDGISFENYGAHSDSYPVCYLTAACALGATREELEIFLARFDQALHEFRGTKGKEAKETKGEKAAKEAKEAKEAVKRETPMEGAGAGARVAPGKAAPAPPEGAEGV